MQINHIIASHYYWCEEPYLHRKLSYTKLKHDSDPSEHKQYMKLHTTTPLDIFGNFNYLYVRVYRLFIIELVINMLFRAISTSLLIIYKV